MKNQIRPLSLTSYFYTMAITCYEEQLKDGEERLFSSIRSASSEEYQIVAIKHNKGIGKTHYHILVRLAKNKKRMQVKTMLNMLHIRFQPGIDDALLTQDNHTALETCGDFSTYAVYLLHQTETAIADNKDPYDKTEFITNLAPAEMDAILSGYFTQKKPLNQKRMSSLLPKIKDAGYNLLSFKQQISSYNILGLSLSQEERLRKAYCQGVTERLRTKPDFYRLTIEIEYPRSATIDVQKHICQAILSAIRQYDNAVVSGSSVCFIDPTIQALFWADYPNDAILPDHPTEIYKLSENKITTIEKPIVEKKTIWAGKYFVLTHNYIARSAEEFHQIYGDRYLAVTPMHKFADNSFLCTIEKKKLKCIELPDNEYSDDVQKYIKDQFLEFKHSFDEAYDKIPVKKYSKINIDDLNI